MKKITQILATACIAVFLFTSDLANAQAVVHFDDLIRPTKATSITNLTVNGTAYDIEFFVGQDTTADLAYGDYPGTYTFITEADARTAVAAMNVELNAAGALSIGIPFSLEYSTFRIGFEGFLVGPTNIEYCNTSVGVIAATIWDLLPDAEGAIYNIDVRQWARFTPVLGVNDDVFESSISVYPNPADNYINLKTEAYIKSIYMSDVTGKVVQHLRFEEGEARTLDVSMLRSGLYFLKMEDDKGRLAIKKIIIE